MITNFDQLTPRESILMEAEAEAARLAREHEVTITHLTLASKKDLKELELQLKIAEADLRRIPILILHLFMVPFLGLAYIITKLQSQPVEPDFWKFLR